MLAVFAGFAHAEQSGGSSVYSLEAQRARTSGAKKEAVQPVQAQQEAMPRRVQQPGLLTGNIGEIVQYRIELNLTNQQLESMQGLVNEFEPVATKIDAEMRICRNDISKSLKQAAPDFTAAQEKMKALAGFQSDLRIAMLGLYEKVYNELTAEQKATYLELTMSNAEPAANRQPAVKPAAAKPRANTQPAVKPAPAAQQKQQQLPPLMDLE
jgi:hypothetical protein